MWRLSRLGLKVPKGCWASHVPEEELFLISVWHNVPGLGHGLFEQNVLRLRLFIKLRICLDPRAASFICLIIVEETRRKGDSGEEWP